MMTRRLLASAALIVVGLASSEATELTPLERRILAALDTSRTAALTRRLSEEVVQTRSGAGAGTAVAGSPEEKALAGAIEQEMKALGLAVRRESFPVRFYQYGEVSLTAAGRKTPAVTLHSGGGTWGSRDGVSYRRGTNGEGGELRVPLVDAGEGFVADYARAGDVRGKAVLVRRTLWPNYSIIEAAQRGASAILIYDYPGEAPDDALKQDSVAYHDPIPTVAISKADAAWLKSETRRRPLEIVLENRVDVSDGISENVIGVLPGSERPEEWVAVTAHHDRWFQGAQDDSVGVAVMLELARVFAREYRPRRSLLFISFGAEEAGGLAAESDWLAGSYAFAKAHPEVTSRLAYAFNVDGAGWSAESGYLFATLDNLPFQRNLLADLGLEKRVSLRSGVTNWVDAWSLGSIGGGAVAYLLWFEGHPSYRGPDSFSPYYHTQHDLYRPEWYRNLEHDLRLGALGVVRSDQALVLPIHFTEIASWTDKTLEADSVRTPGVSFEGARRAAGELREQALRVESAFSSIQSPETAASLNGWLMKTRADLIPWLLSSSSSGAVLKTSPYASDLEALGRARSSAENGDGAGAAAALEEVATMSYGKRLSPEAYLAERLFAYSTAGWSKEFDHEPRAVSPEVHAIYRRLRDGSPSAAEIERIAQLEAEARGFLAEALFVVTGKLGAAARALREAPLP